MKHPLLLLLLVLPAWGSCRAPMDRAAFVVLGASVLKIEVHRAQGGYSLGSGVVVDAGKVVTNCHVTRDARAIYVIHGDVRRQVQAQASDVVQDLCVLQVPDVTAHAVELGRSSDLKVGQSVTALGYTGGVGIQSSPGNVVALHRYGGSNVIQSSNWFSSGASGGGLFDDDLRLVGILTFRLRGGAAHYFAAPVEWLRQILDDRSRFKAVMPINAQELAYWQEPVDIQPNFLKAAILERDANWPGLASLAAGWTIADANDPEPWYLLGLAQEELNQLPAARHALERSLAIEPASSEAWRRLGLLYTRQGLKDLASQALARLLELNSQRAIEKF